MSSERDYLNLEVASLGIDVGGSHQRAGETRTVGKINVTDGKGFNGVESRSLPDEATENRHANSETPAKNNINGLTSNVIAADPEYSDQVGYTRRRPVLRGIERRVAPRHRVNKKATIIFNEKRSTMSCVVTDISDSGARLTLPIGAIIPEVFTLLLVAENVAVDVERVRRAPNDIGVKFIGERRRKP